MTVRKPRSDAELLAELQDDNAWTEPRQARLDALGLDIALRGDYRLRGVKLTPAEFDQLLALAEKGAQS